VAGTPEADGAAGASEETGTTVASGVTETVGTRGAVGALAGCFDRKSTRPVAIAIRKTVMMIANGR
jgi:hypothetical protein